MKKSDLKLDKEVRLLLEQELDRDIPKPNSPEFQSFLEELQLERPDLFDEVMRGLQVNVTLPAEQQAQQAERREKVRSTVRRTFFRRSQVDGEPVTAKRRIMMYVLVAAFLLMPTMYILGQILPDRSGADGTPAPAAAEDPGLQNPNVTSLQPQRELPVEPELEPEPEPEPQPEPEPKPEPEPEPEPQSEPEPEPKPEPKPSVRLPPPPRDVRAEAAPPAPRPAPTPPRPAPRAAPAPAELEPEAALPETLSVFTEEARPLPNQLQVYGDDAPAQAPDQLGVFAAEETRPDSLGVGDTGGERPAELSIAEAESGGLPEQTVLFDAAEESGGAELGRNPPSQPETAPTEPDVAAETVPEGQLFPVGTRVPASLVTGIVVAQGSSVPVVAETSGEWCAAETCPTITWIGRATLDGLDRVQVTLEQSLMGESLRTAQGVALAADAAPGLTAEIRDESPSFAEELLGSSLGGVSDYVKALTQQQKVTVIDGVALAETQVPEVDAFILGRVASLFSTPQTADAGPTIRVADVPIGTPLTVLYGVAGNAQP